MDLLYWFLPLILLLGIVSSYSDIKNKKIRNRWIIVGIVYAFAVNLFIAANSLISGTATASSVLSYYAKYLSNVAIAFIVSFIIWENRIWHAGDAKLFSVFVMLLPISVYSNNYIPFFPSLILLINIFVPYSGILAVKVLAFSSKEKKIGFLKNIKKNFLADILMLLLISIGILAAVKKAIGSVSFMNNASLSLLIYFFVSRQISSFVSKLRKKYKFINAVLLVSALLLSVFFILIPLGRYNTPMERLAYILFLVLASVPMRIMSLVADHEEIRRKAMEEDISFAPGIFLGVILTMITKGLFYKIVL